MNEFITSSNTNVVYNIVVYENPLYYLNTLIQMCKDGTIENGIERSFGEKIQQIFRRLIDVTLQT